MREDRRTGRPDGGPGLRTPVQSHRDAGVPGSELPVERRRVESEVESQNEACKNSIRSKQGLRRIVYILTPHVRNE